MKGFPVLAALLLLAGCGPARQPVVYEDEQGFRLTPPPGWSERARPATGAAEHRKQPDLPLPPLGVPGAEGEERLLVRYDRASAGRLAWLFVTTATLPESLPLDKMLSRRTPRPDWQRQGEVQLLDVAGRPAARVVFTGRWNDQDYRCEIVAVRKDRQVNFIMASFPHGDDEAREQVYRSVTAATWR